MIVVVQIGLSVAMTISTQNLVNYIVAMPAVNKFLQMMLQEVKYCRSIMTEDDENHFQNATACHICEKQYLTEDKRVCGYCHVTGKYRGSAHEVCNLNLRLTDKIPVILHHLRGYDSHLIMQQIGDVVKNNTFKNKGEEQQMMIN